MVEFIDMPAVAPDWPTGPGPCAHCGHAAHNGVDCVTCGCALAILLTPSDPE